MSQTRISAERVVEAPADVVYHCIADYREHHNPGGFLPPAFTAFQVDHGGVGAGTRITFSMKAGGRTGTMTADITEPVPGRVLLETGDKVQTTFTVEPEGASRSRVRFDTVIEAGGLEGLMTRLFASRMLRPLYADELARLERYAQQHGPVQAPVAVAS
jgi:hypothetical protein